MPFPDSTFELVLTGGDDPRHYVAFVPDGEGGRAAEHVFEWRIDSVALAQDLGTLARAAQRGTPPENDLHRTFGRRLFEAVFGGPVGELWRARRAELRPRRRPLRLVVRVDPAIARPLLNLPWEYLHDGDDFLALDWRTPISRLPWGIEPLTMERLEEPLRVLVLVAAPLGLSQNEVLDARQEEDIILGALGGARRIGPVQIEFAPNGALETLERMLAEFDPHILHFTGHGVFVRQLDRGFLLMETPDGRKREVPHEEFVRTLSRRGRSLRGVFFSACQTAVAPRTEGFLDLGSSLLREGIPAVVAMQYSVLNRSAIRFGSAFYRSIADGEPVDEAMTEARGVLAAEGPNTVDFATPVLFLADPHCLQVDAAALREPPPQAQMDLTGVMRAQRFVGRSAELRTLQTHLDPRTGDWRAAIVHGLGGMGKTVLAARLAERMGSRLAGVVGIRMTPTTTAQALLERLADFLLLGNARWNHPAIPAFVEASRQPVALEAKTASLIEVLRGLPLLVILDNYEDVLPQGQAVSRAAEEEEATEGVDPDLGRLVAMLLGNVEGPSRFLFTSRVDFEPVERGRLGGAVGHVSLGEMGFRDAVYLMETLEPLDGLPVATMAEVRPGAAPAPRALSMRDVYGKVGGHPYTLILFAEHARRSSVGEVLDDLSGVRKEALRFTLLERAVAQLPERARVLLERAAIYDEAVPEEGLAFLLGDERDAMPEVGEEIAALEEWGLLSRLPGERRYAVHTLVREWARARMGPEEREHLLHRAADFWLAWAQDSGDLAHWLNARHYLFLAGAYEAADDIVQAVTELLHRWGQIGLLLHLLHESVRTVEGKSRAVALGNLATVYQGLGEYRQAREMHEQARATFDALGDRRNVAVSLHQLGMLHQVQGEYGRAREMYEQSLAIKQELGDRTGVARSLGQLGILYQAQGEYGRARERYEQALAIAQELGDRAGVARSLHNLGLLLEKENDLDEAVQYIAAAYAIFTQLGSPDQEIAAQTLARLREKMGEAAFRAALERAGAAPSSGSAAPEVGLEQALSAIAANTVAVLTVAPQHREAWWNTLGQLAGQAREQGAEEFAAFLGVLQRLVEGARPASLSAAVPQPFRPVWEAIVQGLEAWEQGGGHGETGT